MAFVLDQSDSYSWPVRIQVPQDGGKFRSFTFDVQFRRVSQSRREEIGRQLLTQKRKLELGMVEDDAMTARQMADELVVGWSGILESDGGAEVPFSARAKAQLLDIGDVADAILVAWNESIPGAKVGN